VTRQDTPPGSGGADRGDLSDCPEPKSGFILNVF